MACRILDLKVMKPYQSRQNPIQFPSACHLRKWILVMLPHQQDFITLGATWHNDFTSFEEGEWKIYGYI